MDDEGWDQSKLYGGTLVLDVVTTLTLVSKMILGYRYHVCGTNDTNAAHGGDIDADVGGGAAAAAAGSWHGVSTVKLMTAMVLKQELAEVARAIDDCWRCVVGSSFCGWC